MMTYDQYKYPREDSLNRKFKPFNRLKHRRASGLNKTSAVAGPPCVIFNEPELPQNELSSAHCGGTQHYHPLDEWVKPPGGIPHISYSAMIFWVILVGGDWEGELDTFNGRQLPHDGSPGSSISKSTKSLWAFCPFSLLKSEKAGKCDTGVIDLRVL
ncbi:hypothetical protein FA13DRAFT_1888159 [Coprinellus micaceus]|uniref:Uncharacterized protein n=1 Tax=Coprinellus micaceus TaxID=71717 RepID=A0A4Y7SYH4_COPMI|nr:hypothetical protein FA13DRAFT_1888159 [Coprinellus micaceus]